jgi:hypothetical protein
MKRNCGTDRGTIGMDVEFVGYLVPVSSGTDRDAEMGQIGQVGSHFYTYILTRD